MIAGRTRPAGATRVDSKHFTPQPRLLVFQLAAELAPALIENRLIKAGLGVYASSWCPKKFLYALDKSFVTCCSVCEEESHKYENSCFHAGSQRFMPKSLVIFSLAVCRCHTFTFRRYNNILITRKYCEIMAGLGQLINQLGHWAFYIGACPLNQRDQDYVRN